MHKVPIKITIQNEYTKYPWINLYHYIDFKLKGALYIEIELMMVNLFLIFSLNG